MSRPTPEQVEEHVCRIKKSFVTKRRAKDAAKNACHRVGKKLYVYKCPLCGDFHLSSTKKGVRR